MIDAGAQHARQFQRRAVDVHDVAAGVHACRSGASSRRGRGRRVSCAGCRSRSDRGPSPISGCGRRRRAALACVRRATTSSIVWRPRQTCRPDRRGRNSRNRQSARYAPSAAVAVAFDQPRHQHLVGEARVELMLAPAGELCPECPRRECGRRARRHGSPTGRAGFMVRILRAS